jgi:hypothetical protein
LTQLEENLGALYHSTPGLRVIERAITRDIEKKQKIHKEEEEEPVRAIQKKKKKRVIKKKRNLAGRATTRGGSRSPPFLLYRSAPGLRVINRVTKRVMKKKTIDEKEDE